MDANGAEIEAPATLRAALRRESALVPLGASAAVFLAVGERWLAILPDVVMSSLAFAWVFAMIIVGSMSVVRHAEDLAEILGEPYGTLILTLSVSAIEIVTLGIVMTTGAPNPELARDTMFSVVMLCLNGLIGASLILGALKYKEQDYNLRGANAYLSVIVSLAVFGLVVPNFTFTTPGPTFSGPQEGFLVVMCIGLYTVFLAIQTTRHRSFFVEHGERVDDDELAAGRPKRDREGVRLHVAFLVVHLAVTLYLVEKLAVLLDHGLDELGAPPAFGALIVAALVLAPEGLGGIQAALANRMQRAVNILLGSALATLALTIPAVVLIGFYHHKTVVLGLDPIEQAMLLLTLFVSTITYSSGRTNVLQGAVHIMLLLAYLMLIIWH
jgi:Ca2+:H+ antiporter